ncbi:hypothetical protein KAR91_23615 [Candidatus Pacearchaeota archaeon]|nr:hypothetical protein [Candidatus Pacearchaeota archaeon]
MARENDIITRFPVRVDSVHAHLHEGELFHCGASIATAVADELSLSFKTGVKECHMVLEWDVEDIAVLTVREGGDWTTDTGTPVDILNAKRASSNESELLEDKSATPAFAATMAMLQDVTSPANGAVLDALTRQSWTAFNRGVEGGRSENEIILAPDTAYTFLLASGNGDKGMGLYLTWYEHGIIGT